MTKEELAMTSLLVLLYIGVGLVEWAVSLFRILACSKNKRLLLIVLVFIENLLGFFVLSIFIRSNDWWFAVSYSIGGTLGAIIVSCFLKEKPKVASKEPKATKVPKKKLKATKKKVH
jgi:predicted membrane protein